MATNVKYRYCLPLTKISSSPLLSYLNNHFLDCIALYRQSHTLVLPPKIFSSLITSSSASFFFSVFICSPRSALTVFQAAFSVPNPRASCLAVRCTRFLGMFAAERSTYASFPIEYSVSVDFRFTTLFRATWQRYYSV